MKIRQIQQFTSKSKGINTNPIKNQQMQPNHAKEEIHKTSMKIKQIQQFTSTSNTNLIKSQQIQPNQAKE